MGLEDLGLEVLDLEEQDQYSQAIVQNVAAFIKCLTGSLDKKKDYLTWTKQIKVGLKNERKRMKESLLLN